MTLFFDARLEVGPITQCCLANNDIYFTHDKEVRLNRLQVCITYFIKRSIHQHKTPTYHQSRVGGLTESLLLPKFSVYDQYLPVSLEEGTPKVADSLVFSSVVLVSLPR